MRRWLPVILLVILSLALCSPAMAKKRKSLTKKQQQLNENAVKAMIDGDYERAIGLFNLSLELGELNITYLNLGRALAKNGQCVEASNAYDKVGLAPEVREPSPEEIEEILVEYRADVQRECPGDVIIRCSPAEMEISIDKGDKQPCPTEVIQLEPGDHSFAAYLDGRAVDQKLTRIEGMSSTTVDLKAPAKSIAGPATVPASEQGVSALEVTGWSGIALGAGFLISALIVDQVVLANDMDNFDAAVDAEDFARANQLKDSIDTNQTLNVALFATGGSLMAVGTALVLWGYLDRTSSDTSAAVSWTPEGPAFSLTTRW